MSGDAGLNAKQDENEVSLLDLLYTAVSNWKLLIFGPLLAGVIALGVTFLIAPTFTATTKFLLPQQQSSAASMLQSLGALGGLAGSAAGIKSPVDQYVAFLQSRSVLDALVQKLDLTERYETTSMQGTLGALTANTKISSGKDGLVSIGVDDKDPEFAAKLANAYVQELRNLLDRLAVTEAQQRRQFFEKQLQKTKAELAQAERALRDTGIDASALKNDPTAAVALVAQLQASITAQEVKLSAMRAYLTESAPELKHAQAELKALRAQAAQAGLAASKDGGDSDYVSKYRDLKYQETLFDLYAKQFEMAKLDEAREGTTLQVLDPAQPPEFKSKPKKASISVMVAVATFVLLLVFVFLRQAVRASLQDPVTVARWTQVKAALRS